MEMGVIMQKIAHVSKTAILFISVLFISCVNNKAKILIQYPKQRLKLNLKNPIVQMMVGKNWL